MSIHYRVCTTNEELASVVALEQAVWRVSDADTITPHIMHVIVHIGGLILGAYDGDTMVGMAVAAPAKQQGLLWSHMAGVLPEYQGQGIGYQIKHVQRDWAIENGFTEIHWSFDPAMRRNANFNFHQLGVVTNLYHPNFYGEMSDGINAGVPSDRFEAIWKLESPSHKPDTLPDKLPFLLEASGNQIITNPDATGDYLAVACPYDFPAIKAQSLTIAKIWRDQMRHVFQDAFAKGYYVVDFVTNREDKSCYYVLQQGAG